jgi:hypothetical protein
MRPPFSKLLKTHIEKMSVFRLSTMLMKTRELNRSLHDVDEKKGESRWAQGKRILNAGMCGRKIGLSVHWFIDLSANHGIGLRGPDDPIWDSH